MMHLHRHCMAFAWGEKGPRFCDSKTGSSTYLVVRASSFHLMALKILPRTLFIFLILTSDCGMKSDWFFFLRVFIVCYCGYRLRLMFPLQLYGREFRNISYSTMPLALMPPSPFSLRRTRRGSPTEASEGRSRRPEDRPQRRWSPRII